MSTNAERLALMYQAFQTAKSNRAADLKQATTEAEVDAILANIDSLNATYLQAVNADLTASGGAIEAAYNSAKAAAEAATDARLQAQGLVNIIKKTTEAANKLKSLVDVLT